MNRPSFPAVRTLCIAGYVAFFTMPAAGQSVTKGEAPLQGSAERSWTLARTPDGHPDLQGIWDTRSATPLERPAEYYRGSAANLHLVERFRRVDANTLEYRVTVTDPTTWKSPWTITLPMVKSHGLVYEYACHEGNYGLRNMLTVARAGDQGAAADLKKPD
jgi:hypothetical protein